MARKAAKRGTKGSPGTHEEIHVDRLAAGVDPAVRAANIRQLRRARGQASGVERMLEDDRYCTDIITQITAARASLQVVAQSLLESHLKTCHSAAISGDGAAADRMYQDLVCMVSQMSR